MFTLKLIEKLPPAFHVDPATGSQTSVPGSEVFIHFEHNYKAFPADKLARIQAILAEPSPPTRRTRSDAGKPKPKTKPATPPQPTLDIP